MHWFHLLLWFVAGAALMNAMPHMVSGLMGRPFQTPFPDPPGDGRSSSAVNLLWGFGNLILAYLLVCHVGAFDLRDPVDAAALGLGMVLLGLFAARHFGRFHGGNLKEES